MKNDKKEPQDTTRKSSHEDMPIKTTGTNDRLNTAEENGLNKEKTNENSLEPGTSAQDPDFTETD